MNIFLESSALRRIVSLLLVMGLAILTMHVGRVLAADPTGGVASDLDIQPLQPADRGMGMGRGMMGMGGAGTMGGHHEMLMGRGPIAMLDLTDEQSDKIDKIEDGLRRKNWDLMGKSMDEAAKLRDLYSAPKRDPKAIGAVYGSLFNLKRQMIENTIEARNSMEVELTDKQREELRQMRRNMRSRPGMGSCMMHGNMPPR